MKREYFEPQMKSLDIEADELMDLSAFNKNLNSQDIIPEDDEYDGEFGTNGAFWSEDDLPKFNGYE